MRPRHPEYRAKRPGKQQVRHTHSTAAALEDVIAILWDILRELAASLQYAQARSKKALDILQETRAGPHAYNPDGHNTKELLELRRRK